MTYLNGCTRNTSDIIANFSDAMRRRGLIRPNDLIPDDRLHCCRVDARASSIKNADYDNGSVRTWVPS